MDNSLEWIVRISTLEGETPCAEGLLGAEDINYFLRIFQKKADLSAAKGKILPFNLGNSATSKPHKTPVSVEWVGFFKRQILSLLPPKTKAAGQNALPFWRVTLLDEDEEVCREGIINSNDLVGVLIRLLKQPGHLLLFNRMVHTQNKGLSANREEKGISGNLTN